MRTRARDASIRLTRTQAQAISRSAIRVSVRAISAGRRAAPLVRGGEVRSGDRRECDEEAEKNSIFHGVSR